MVGCCVTSLEECALWSWCSKYRLLEPFQYPLALWFALSPERFRRDLWGLTVLLANKSIPDCWKRTVYMLRMLSVEFVNEYEFSVVWQTTSTYNYRKFIVPLGGYAFVLNLADLHISQNLIVENTYLYPLTHLFSEFAKPSGYILTPGGLETYCDADQEIVKIVGKWREILI